MNRFSLLRSLIAMPFAIVSAQAKPTLLSTDIGTDIDDTWALAHILRSPELELDMVLTETGESAYRASLAAKLLQIADRSDVDVALGITFGEMGDDERHQGPWVEDYDLNAYPGEVHLNGVDAAIAYLESQDGPITVIAIGPAPSLAKAVTERPDLAKKCNLYGMFGSFDRGYGGSPDPEPEYNVYDNVGAFRDLMAAPWASITLTPLDTCGLMNLSGENYRRVWSATSDPLTRSVIENYCIWAPRAPWMDGLFFTQRSSTLFDDVAVFMAYSDAFLNYENIRFSVDDDGLTRRDPEGLYHAKVAITWKDLPGFQAFLANRLLGSKASPK